ncbi:ATP-binding protein [Ponticaulis sp.]|uniref:sensor histidine kinase n=1 Tax=Ponticaulis sp. TaxID=2020902 RepID=UPI000C5C2EB2|nr:ATP-binding protein [Ponticaulis sp.]MAJ10571.1 hypothetical protein [Ponticaulis sp.]HBJ94210.1 hypothetical protein [Hyphomonadaceae bacterium]|tara:strand:+ start:6493 stop:8229 length:1737 start_codon:yes stop_codon:yes gene_type:complete
MAFNLRSLRSWEGLSGVLILLGILGVALWTAVLSPRGDRVPRSDVSVIADTSAYMNRRVSDFSEAHSLTSRAGLQSEGRYRYIWRARQAELLEHENLGIAYLGAGGPTYLLVNGVEVWGAFAISTPFPGLGGYWRVAPVPQNLLVPGTNRIEIVSDLDPFRSDIRQIYTGDFETLAGSVERYNGWLNALMRVGILMAGIVLSVALLAAVTVPKRMKANGGFALMGALLFAEVYLAGWGATLIGPSWAGLAALGLVFVIALLTGIYAYRCRVGPRFYCGRLAGLGLLILTVCAGGVLVINAVLPLSFLPVMTVKALFWLGLSLFILIESGGNVLLQWWAHRSEVDALTRKVQEQALELDEKSRLIAFEMRNRAIMEERQRFTRDIHDGLGGQLLSLLVQVRSGRLNKSRMLEEIQSSLNDLRLIVDSIDHMGDDLVAVLSAFHVRAEAQLVSAGLTFDWRQPEVINGDIRGSGSTLNLYRMIQESLTNAIRHAKAQYVSVRIEERQAQGELVIHIEDDGVGIPAERLDTPGKGIRNLRRRAEMLNGSVSFEPSGCGDGTRVIIRVPLEQADDQIMIQPI